MEIPTDPVLLVEDLCVGFPNGVIAANGVSLAVGRGKTLGVVGESGSGKTITLRALIGLLPASAHVLGGTLTIGGEPCDWEHDLRRKRGRVLSMIFQDPGASLNPVRRIGDQLTEVLRVKTGLNRAAAAARAIELLDHVGIPNARRRVRAYPHELSGGMRQRVMIAMAIAPGPQLLLADEPTTALDVTTQEQILALLRDLQREIGMAIVFVTHDLGVVSDMCDDVLVMYGGYVVDRGPVELVTERPRHPYTRGLVAAVPQLDVGRLPRPIPGQPPDMEDLPPGCPFAPRCPQARPACDQLEMAIERAYECACPFAGGRRPDAAAVRG